MKNPTVVVIAIAVIAILGVGAFVIFQNSSKPDSMMKNETAIMQKVDQPVDSKDTMMQVQDNAMEDDKTMDSQMAESRYVLYSKPALEKAASGRRVLFFYASWCPTCKPADASIAQNANKLPEDVTIVRVNYNDTETDQEEKDLAKKYGVTYQHTFVQIDGQGKEVTKWNGGKIDELLKNIK